MLHCHTSRFVFQADRASSCFKSTTLKAAVVVQLSRRFAEYGGHIAGAVSYPWRTVFDTEGNLRRLETIRSEIIALDTRGFDARRQIIVYCTRGVRASFAVASFVGAGFNITLHEGAAPHSPELSASSPLWR